MFKYGEKIMKKNTKKMKASNTLKVSLPLLAALALATPTTAQAEGFALQNWSARGAGLAGGLVARGGDPSAVAYNPAAITELEGTQIMVGGEFIMPEVHYEFDNFASVDSKSYNFFVPNAYFTHKLNDKVSLGLGMFSRFGLGAKYPHDWVGSFSTYSVTILTSTVNPVIAYKVTDKLSVAAGIELSGALVDLKQSIPTPLGTGSQDLTGDLSLGIAFNLAAHYRFNDQWAMGLTYRMGPKYDLEGDVIRYAPDGTTVLQETTGSATLYTPDQINFAVAYSPMPTLSFEAGFGYVMWSKYRDLDMVIAGQEHVNPKHWHDTFLFSLSAEYQVLDWMTLRAGVSYETSPMNHKYAEYLLPTDGRFNYGVGVGFHKDNWAIDLAYNYHDINTLEYDEVLSPVIVNESESVGSGAHAFSVGFTYKF